MTKVRYEVLAGPNYPGLEDKYMTDASNKKNKVYTYAVPAIHPSFGQQTEASGPPSNIKIVRDRTRKTSDGAYIATSSINTTYREIFHSFRYFESLGSVYGSHNIIMDKDNDAKMYMREIWQGEPIFAEKISKMGLTNTSRLDSTENSCALTLIASINSDGEIEIDSGIPKADGEDEYLEVYIGEFHLLPDSPRSIYRCNLSYDIHPIQDTIKSNDGNYCISNGDSLSNLTFSNGLDLPQNDVVLNKPSLSITDSSFLEFYLGLSRLPGDTYRPIDMQREDISMRFPNYLEGGAGIRWKSLKDSCSTWIRIYDGTNLNELEDIEHLDPGHYVINTKVKINTSKLKIYIKDILQNMGYNIPWKLVIYLPWFSMLGHDSVREFVYPKISSFLDMFDQIEFKCPKNYKSGGSFHFSFEIFSHDNEKKIFSESSRGELYYDDDYFMSRPKLGTWFFIDGEDRRGIPKGIIKFNADHTDGSGINHEEYPNIGYIPSIEVANFITKNDGVYIRVITHDGTLTNNNGLIFK